METGLDPSSKAPAPADKDTFFIIPHTHWEGAVFQTRETYLEMGLPNILRALKLLKTSPNSSYRFTLDQVCYVRPFLERYPEEEATFRKLVDEGRLAIVGGTNVMLDVNMPSGESFVRQVLYGKGYFRRKLGVDVTVGWQLDTFGHHAQMPQLLKLAGYKSFWFFRGVPNWETPSEFLWEGIDGSQIPAFWLPHGYAVGHGSPNSLPGFTSFVKERFDSLAPFARGRGRAGPAGPDVCEPEEHLAELVEAFNGQPDQSIRLRLAVPTDFEAWVAQRPDRPVIRGELNPIFQGAYSSRIEMKQRTRELERLLTTAEKLGVLLRWLGTPVDDEILWSAWEPMLFNQAHDLMSGVMTDVVYEDTIRGYDFSRRIAQDEVRGRLGKLSSLIDTCNAGPPYGGLALRSRLEGGVTCGEGVPIIVFNTLGWARTDIAIAEVGFSDGDVQDLKLVGPDGSAVRRIPVQILKAQRHGSGALITAEIAFVARDVPALGHSVYRLLPLKCHGRLARPCSASPPPPGQEEDPDTAGQASRGTDEDAAIENEHYRIEFDAAGGAMTRLVVKEGNWDALSGPGNVVAREEDRGDFWELYKPLDGGSRIAMKDRHGVPQQGSPTTVFSTCTAFQAATKSQSAVRRTGGAEDKDPRGTVTHGPVVSEFTVSHPFGDRGSFRTSVRLYAGLRRIDIHTQILNDAKFVRYRVLFPIAIQNGQSVHEIPFGAIQRPEGIEFPAQNWIDYGDGAKGVALLNRGLPGNNVSDGTLMLSLLRSTCIVAYGFFGGYGPGMSSDTGLELGKELAFDYALVPHAGDWRQAAVYREGMEFNNPLIACPAASHPGVLPSRSGFLEITHPCIVVSTLKRGPDGAAILRLYEAAGQPARGVRIRFSAKVCSAEEVNLMEDPGRELPVEQDTVQLDFGPFEIKTLKLGQ